MSSALKKIAWAHIFIIFDFNLGTIDLLPNWGGYIMIMQALSVLGEEEPSALLIRPLGILLAMWEGLCWIATAIGLTINIPVVTILVAVVSIYFHFQLLTNIAQISANHNCTQTNKILTLRTVRTILITIFALPIPWQSFEVFSYVFTICVVIIHVVVTIWICSVLFSLKNSLEVL